VLANTSASWSAAGTKTCRKGGLYAQLCGCNASSRKSSTPSGPRDAADQNLIALLAGNVEGLNRDPRRRAASATTARSWTDSARITGDPGALQQASGPFRAGDLVEPPRRAGRMAHRTRRRRTAVSGIHQGRRSVRPAQARLRNAAADARISGFRAIVEQHGATLECAPMRTGWCVRSSNSPCRSWARPRAGARARRRDR